MASGDRLLHVKAYYSSLSTAPANAHTHMFISMLARSDMPMLTPANGNQHLSFKHQQAPRDNLSQINNLLRSERDFIKNSDYNGLNHD